MDDYIAFLVAHGFNAVRLPLSGVLINRSHANARTHERAARTLDYSTARVMTWRASQLRRHGARHLHDDALPQN